MTQASPKNVDIKATRVDRPVLALAAASFATGTEAYVYVSQLESLAGELDASLAEAGALSAAFALAYAITAPIIAAKTAGIDRKMLIFAGLALMAVLNFLAALSSSFLMLLSVRIACGLAAATVGPASSAAAAALSTPEQRGRAMAVVLAGLTLAFVLGIPLGSVVGSVGGWRSTFVFAGALALGAALIVGFAIPRVPGTTTSSLRHLAIARQPAVAGTLLLTLLGFAATFCVIAYIGPLAAYIAGVRGAGVGGLQALIGVGSIAGVIVGGRWSDSSKASPLIVLSFLVSSAALAVYSLLPVSGLDTAGTRYVLMAAMVAGAAALFTRTPLIQARLVRIDPDRASVLLALNGSMVFAGQGLGAAIGAVAIAASGIGTLGAVAAAVALIGASAAVWSARTSSIQPVTGLTIIKTP